MYFETAVAPKLRGVLRTEGLGRLARHRRAANLASSFHTKSVAEVTVKATPTRWGGQPSVFLPTRELLTIYSGFVSL